uniref:EGF-like domain-containing protein n=1 Tax=Macrostomum lignano TaxID=282301 RepID=A0A1I8JRW5_9PLAT
PNCENNIGSCSAAASAAPDGVVCHNGGDCLDKVGGGFRCRCPAGWFGDRCASRANPCQSRPCANSALCRPAPNWVNFSCDCSTADGGFSGPLCLDDIDECQAAGRCDSDGTQRCLNTVGSFKCVCKPGFVGEHCDRRADRCASVVCLNGGWCDPGRRLFDGFDCFRPRDNCFPSPCLNGGQCRTLVDAYVCTCPPSYGGLDCEKVNACSNSSCLGRGTCRVEQRIAASAAAAAGQPDFRCDCHSGFGGQFCQDRIRGGAVLSRGSGCSDSLCSGVGRCFNDSGTILCQCPFGYSGRRCESPVNPCDSNPCRRGGTCVAGLANGDPTNYTCLCKPGFQMVQKAFHAGAIDQDVKAYGGQSIRCQGLRGAIVSDVKAYVGEAIFRSDVKGYGGKSSDVKAYGGNRSDVKAYGAIDPDVKGLRGASHQMSKAYGGQIDQMSRLQVRKRGACDPRGTEVCIDGVASFTCRCLPGFTGQLCNRSIDYCLPTATPKPPRCLNGGACAGRIGANQRPAPSATAPPATTAALSAHLRSVRRRLRRLSERRSLRDCRRQSDPLHLSAGHRRPALRDRLHQLVQEFGVADWRKPVPRRPVECRDLPEGFRCRCQPGLCGPTATGSVLRLRRSAAAGNGVCDPDCDSLACDWDGGDCASGWQPWANCTAARSGDAGGCIAGYGDGLCSWSAATSAACSTAATATLRHPPPPTRVRKLLQRPLSLTADATLVATPPPICSMVATVCRPVRQGSCRRSHRRRRRRAGYLKLAVGGRNASGFRPDTAVGRQFVRSLSQRLGCLVQLAAEPSAAVSSGDGTVVLVLVYRLGLCHRPDRCYTSADYAAQLPAAAPDPLVSRDSMLLPAVVGCVCLSIIAIFIGVLFRTFKSSASSASRSSSIGGGTGRREAGRLWCPPGFQPLNSVSSSGGAAAAATQITSVRAPPTQCSIGSTAAVGRLVRTASRQAKQALLLYRS